MHLVTLCLIREFARLLKKKNPEDSVEDNLLKNSLAHLSPHPRLSPRRLLSLSQARDTDLLLRSLVLSQPQLKPKLRNLEHLVHQPNSTRKPLKIRSPSSGTEDQVFRLRTSICTLRELIARARQPQLPTHQLLLAVPFHSTRFLVSDQELTTASACSLRTTMADHPNLTLSAL